MSKTTNISVQPVQDENSFNRSSTVSSGGSKSVSLGERKVLANISNSIGAFVRGLKIGKKDNKRKTGNQSKKYNDQTVHIREKISSVSSQSEEKNEDEVLVYCSEAMNQLSLKEEYFLPKNSFLCSPEIRSGDRAHEYEDEISCYLRKKEYQFLPPNDFMKMQSDITSGMRSILVDWLIEVQVEFNLMEETLFLSVNLLDRFLSTRSVSRHKLQLVGLAALLIACKYEELECPYVDMFIDVSDKAYTREELIIMERLILTTLEFNITICSVPQFISLFLYQLNQEVIDDRTDHLMYISYMFAEMTLLDDSFTQFSPSLIASASICSAMFLLDTSPEHHQLKNITGYEKRDLDPCCVQINKIARIHLEEFRKPQQSRRIQAILMKYGSTSYMQVTRYLVQKTVPE